MAATFSPDLLRAAASTIIDSELGSPDLNPLKTPARVTVIRDVQTLTEEVDNRGRGTFVGSFTDDEANNTLLAATFSYPGSNDNVDALAIVDIDVTFEDHAFSTLILCRLLPKGARKVLEVLDGIGVRYTVLSSSGRDTFHPDGHGLPTDGGVTIRRHTYVETTPQTYGTLLGSHNYDSITKIISAYWVWCPAARSFIASHFTEVHAPPNDGAQVADDIVLCQCIVGVLTPAFPLAVKRATQLNARMTALCASLNHTPPTLATLTGVLNSAAFGEIDMSGDLLPMILNAFVLDKQGYVNPEVTKADLMPIDTFCQRFELGPLMRALTIQGRMVFEQFHATTASFGVAVLELVEPYCQALGGKFEEQYKFLNSNKQLILDCPYLGMQSTVPEESKVDNAARIDYIGLRYHGRCLTNPEDIDQWKKYNIMGVSNHIDPASDVATCDAIASSLPLRVISVAVRLGKTLSSEKMKGVLLAYSPEEVDTIYRYLLGSGTLGAWASERLAREKKAETGRLMKETMETLQRELQTTSAAKMQRIGAIQDNDERKDAMEEYNEWQAEVQQAMRASVSFDDIVPLSSVEELAEVRDSVMKRLTVIYNAIHEIA